MSDIVWTIIAAFGGGLAGAIVSAVVTWKVKGKERKDWAEEALWAYQFALAAYCRQAYSWVVDDKIMLLTGDLQQVRDRLRAAYPFAGFLSEPVRRKLFTEAELDVLDSGDELERELSFVHADSAYTLAVMLEEELDRVFPLPRSTRMPRKICDEQ